MVYQSDFIGHKVEKGLIVNIGLVMTRELTVFFEIQ